MMRLATGDDLGLLVNVVVQIEDSSPPSIPPFFLLN